MALNGLFCADVPLRNYSLTHAAYSHQSGLDIGCVVRTEVMAGLEDVV